MVGYQPYGRERIFDVRTRLLAKSSSEDRGYETQCLIFEGEKDRDGYGKIKSDGRYVPAHYVLKGRPPKDKESDHLCGQRDCVRPTHIEFVTHRVNTKRRRATGDTQHRMTESARNHIKRQLAEGVSTDDLVTQTGFSRRTIRRIAKEENSV